MDRTHRFSTVLFAVMLSPALFQTSLTCDAGDMRLASLELHAGGLDRVVGFEPSTFLYDVWLDGSAQMTVRASSADPRQTVRWTYGDDAGELGRGGGEATVSVLPGSSAFQVHVGPVGGVGRTYKLTIDRPCTAAECNDANDCTSDVCNQDTSACEFLADTEQVSCPFEGGPGVCVSGRCVQGRRWSAPERIGGNTLNAQHAQVEIDPDGNAVVVWREDDGASFNVGANRFTPTEGWSGPERISVDDGAEDFEEPDLAVDANGNAIAVWRQNYHVVSSRFTRADGWGAPARIDTGVPSIETRINGQPQVALQPDGAGVAVWRVINSPTSDGIWSSGFTPADGWSLPERIENYAGEKSTPRVAPTPDGGAIAVWQSGYGTFANISWGRLTPEEGWAYEGLIGTGRWWFPPSLIYNGAGEFMYVWLGDDSFGNQRARRYNPADGWAPDTHLVGATTGYVVSPVMDRDANVLVVWDDIVVPGAVGVLAARSTLAEGFNEPVEIGDTALHGAVQPDVAVHPEGHAIAVFQQPDGVRDNIWFNRFTPARGWETPAPLEQRDTDVMSNPKVAMDSEGNAIAVWEESDESGNKSLWASRYALPSGPDARTEAVVIDDDARSFNPQVAVNARGLAVVVWDSEDGMTARFRHGPADWGFPRIIQDETGNAQFPSVGLDNDDRALVIWQQAPHAGVYFTRHSPELGWEAPGPVDSVDSSFESDGALAVAPNGQAVTLWKSDGIIEGSASAPGQPWSIPTQVSAPSPYDAFNPRPFLGPNGDGFAIWSIVSSSLWSRRYVSGVGFADPELITDTVADSDSPRVAVAADGSAIAVWHRYYAGHGDIWHSHYGVDEGWSAPAELDQTEDPFLFDPQIGMDAQGSAIVIWRQASDDFYDIWSRRYEPDLGWTDSELIELATGQSEDPALAVSSTGHAVAVWSLGRDAQPGLDLDVWANRYTPGEGWGISQQIEYTFRGVAGPPDVGIAGDGTATVVWGDAQDIWCRVLTP